MLTRRKSGARLRGVRRRNYGTGISTWPWISFQVRPEQRAEWDALAERLGRSRSDLLREVLEQQGLNYARGLARMQESVALTVARPAPERG
jgi:sugar (pentulose or hexulose) kinase